jgi:hypothetical protein
MQTSVHSAQRTSLRRPVAWTAATKSASSHELTLVRSIGGLSSSSCASSGIVGFPRPSATLAERLRRLHRRDDVLDQQLVIHRADPLDLRRLVVDDEQHRVLRGDEVVGYRVASRLARHRLPGIRANEATVTPSIATISARRRCLLRRAARLARRRPPSFSIAFTIRPPLVVDTRNAAPRPGRRNRRNPPHDAGSAQARRRSAAWSLHAAGAIS